MAHISEVLRQLDNKVDAKGKQTVFSIGFHLKDGEYVYFNRAVAVGVNGNMSNNAVRGVLPIDQDGNESGHRYPVSIWAILEFNGQKVYL